MLFQSICDNYIKKTYYAIVLILAVAHVSFAQTGLEGKLRDSTENSPIEFGSVVLYSVPDSSLITGTVTKADGSFAIENVKPGIYYLDIQFMGFVNRQISPVALTKNQNVDLGIISLAPDQKLLNEVVVSGQKMTAMHKIDRQVYDVSQFQNSRGGTATDALRNMPSVSINAAGEIMVRGTTGFVVLLNGKPIQSDPSLLLNQLPANAIKT